MNTLQTRAEYQHSTGGCKLATALKMHRKTERIITNQLANRLTKRLLLLYLVSYTRIVQSHAMRRAIKGQQFLFLKISLLKNFFQNTVVFS